MSSRDALTDNEYQRFLSDKSVIDVWETDTDSIFAIADTALFVEKGVGPLEEQVIGFDRLDSYQLSVSTQEKPVYPYIPLVLALICAGLGFIIDSQTSLTTVVVGTVFFGVAVLCLLASGILYVQFLTRVNSETTVTVHVGNFSAECKIPKDVSKELNARLLARAERGEPTRDRPDNPAENLRTRQ